MLHTDYWRTGWFVRGTLRLYKKWLHCRDGPDHILACRQDQRGQGGTEVERCFFFFKYKQEGREGYSRQKNNIEKV